MIGKKALLRATVSCGLLAVAAAIMPTPAAAQATMTYQIRGMSLSQALREFGRRSGRQIIFTEDLVRGRRAPDLVGAFSAEDALARILAGSGLRAERTPTGAYMIVRDSAIEVGNRASDQSESEIVVTGSRLQQRNGSTGPVQVATFDRTRIDEIAGASLPDILAFLPQQSFAFNDSFNFGGAQFAQLRGLPPSETLVLINGRRTFGSGSSARLGQIDIGTIPASFVDHVDIITGSGSSIYGTDAVGGVINIITRQRIERPVLDLYIGGADGGAEERKGTFAFGYNQDNFHVSFAADALARDYLLGADRDFFANNDYRRFGGGDVRALTSNPGNITSTSGNLPGLTSNIAAVPVGSTGTGLTPADFVATQGLQNRESLRGYVSIVPRTRRYSAFATFGWDIGSSTELYGEMFYVNQTVTRLNSPSAVSNALVPASNPFNPFGVPVQVSYLLTGLGPRTDVFEDETLRLVGGIRRRGQRVATV